MIHFYLKEIWFTDVNLWKSTVYLHKWNKMIKSEAPYPFFVFEGDLNKMYKDIINDNFT